MRFNEKIMKKIRERANDSSLLDHGIKATVLFGRTVEIEGEEGAFRFEEASEGMDAILIAFDYTECIPEDREDRQRGIKVIRSFVAKDPENEPGKTEVFPMGKVREFFPGELGIISYIVGPAF